MALLWHAATEAAAGAESSSSQAESGPRVKRGEGGIAEGWLGMGVSWGVPGMHMHAQAVKRSTNQNEGEVKRNQKTINAKV
mmetsp:Transcript_37350/g.76634  ORF Transcript_37350/g.76634 Transcript_37350/m.76634 type:complete len:81 (-) Transcript_37350:111-353(-)|eukprot:CAMPEP_0181325800 /NCGR_PEP_ID=MMETSP1101-20121128/21135_1 /TAXON_ID=46948 /ORGANISM="Rhodomonas abbreviata, Strain Caron Lab Isolate" /LENGTH=80 /DNA_ID=CAMNT_0023434165 /DNA_START=480 /DNA_END=722 /DNA_ORIENTATION=-